MDKSGKWRVVVEGLVELCGVSGSPGDVGNGGDGSVHGITDGVHAMQFGECEYITRLREVMSGRGGLEVVPGMVVDVDMDGIKSFGMCFLLFLFVVRGVCESGKMQFRKRDLTP